MTSTRLAGVAWVLFAGLGLLSCTERQAALSVAENRGAHPGREVFLRNCAVCHGGERFGLLGPPLLPQTLKHQSPDSLRWTIREGISGTRMPSFGMALDDVELEEVVDYIQLPGEIRWTADQIRASRKDPQLEGPEKVPADTSDVTAVVERGTGNILFIHDRRLVGQVYFPNVHGGLKYVGDKLFVPSRTGFILKLDLTTLKPERTVRAGVYMRNMEATDTHIVAACGLPPGLGIFDHDLNLIKLIPLESEPAAIARLNDKQLVVTFRNLPELLILEGPKIVKKVPLPAPFRQFTVVGDLIVGTNGRTIYATDFERHVKVDDDAIVHIAAGQFWRKGKALLWATPKVNGNDVTVYRILHGPDEFSIEKIAAVPAEALTVRGHTNVFVRDHPKLDFLVTTSGYELLVISKKDFRVLKRITADPDRMPLHTEFSKDGETLFLSVYDERGGIYMFRTDDFSLARVIPASKPAGQYNRFMKTWQNERR